MSKGTGVVAGIVLVSVFLFYPFKVTVAPEWDVTVVDEHGHPIVGAFVSEFATQWTLGAEHESAVCTDQHGKAYFPPQFVHASVVSRVSQWISKIGPHSSLGSHAEVIADGLGYGDMEGDRNKEEWGGYFGRVKSQLSLHKCAEGHTGYRCNFDYPYFFSVNSSASQMSECLATPGRRFDRLQ